MRQERSVTPEERVVLAPHIERVRRARVEMEEAMFSLRTAAILLEPRMRIGWSFDAESMAWSGDAPVPAPEVAREGPTGTLPINRVNGKGANG